MTDYIRDPHTDWGDLAEQRLRDQAADMVSLGRLAPCRGYEASDDRQDRDAQGVATIVGNSFAIRRLEAYDDSYLQDMGFVNAHDLPGMWDTSDFLGGDPDERSYAERDAVVVWGNPEPVRLEVTVSIETLEVVIGLPLIPLCQRKLPAEGQE